MPNISGEGMALYYEQRYHCDGELDMTTEQCFFIRILADHINGVNTESTEEINWKMIKTIAQQQQVSAIVYFQTRYPLMQSAFAHQVYHAKNQEVLLDKVRTEFLNASIPFAYVKGAEIKKYYPKPELRSMGDADLIVSIENKPKAGEILERIGFAKTVETNEWVYIKGDFELELHHALAYEKDSFANDQRLNDFWPYVKDNCLDIGYHFIYLLFHLRRHLYSHGAGFRQFMDIAIVCKNAEIDWKWAREELCKVDLLDFAVTVCKMNERWFGIQSPLDGKTVDDEFFEKVTGKIFKDGVFGHDNEENAKTAGIVLATRNEGNSREKARIQYLLEQSFPNYQIMCRLPYCAYIRKSKILLPVAWIHRFLYRLFNKNHRQAFLNRTMTPSVEIDERIKMMKQWGL